MAWMWLVGEFSEPPNIRCSNRWAKPVEPAGSSLEPTLYQMDTATTGALRSSWTMTVRPLSSWKRDQGMSTRATRSATGAPCSGAACGRAGAETTTAGADPVSGDSAQTEEAGAMTARMAASETRRRRMKNTPVD